MYSLDDEPITVQQLVALNYFHAHNILRGGCTRIARICCTLCGRAFTVSEARTWTRMSCIQWSCTQWLLPVVRIVFLHVAWPGERARLDIASLQVVFSCEIDCRAYHRSRDILAACAKLCMCCDWPKSQVFSSVLISLQVDRER